MDTPRKSVPRKSVVRLTPDQRERLTALPRTGNAPARQVAHARGLLPADAAHPGGQRTDGCIAPALGLHGNSGAKTRQRFVRDGEAPALDREPREARPVAPKVGGRVQAPVVAIGRSPAPAGPARRALELLAGELTGRGLVPSVGTEAVRKAREETPSSRGGRSAGVSPNGSRRGS